ncbi:beta-ketoacyl synthase N-terminal-like domain-containing protein [Chitinimonas sp. PSY-7]|uniref:beta-ketoacyl synthase N-terminal-like domain-containing protein n=1 Tax=Chitinimonas sp. PSY-7 TaxID=3459088 RepID=UPI0040403DC6
MFPLDITGLACLVPDAKDTATFWQNLLNGKRSIRSADAADWGVEPTRFLAPGRGVADHVSSLELAKPRDFVFDPNGYHLPAEFLAAQDRCIQWPLHVARQALVDADMWSGQDLKRVGLVLGSYAWAAGSASDALTRPLYDDALAQAFAEVTPNDPLKLTVGRPTPSTHPESARISGGITTTLAHALGLGGPRYAIDAACATSLYAIHLAALHLAAGEADAMVVVAANAFDTLYATFGFAATQALPDGSPNRPFDARSDGVAPADGAVALILRRPNSHRQRVYGVVRAIGLSSDGRGQTLTAPNPKGQQLACERAYAASGIDPKSVAYVECHATGTKLGDRVELETIAKVFGEGQAVGTVKSNVGHLLTAAGVAGLVKTLLAMREGVIPATVGIEQSLAAEIAGKPNVLTEAAPWPSPYRRAAINAFGFGGVNAHLILDALDQTAPETPAAKQPVAPILLSGLGAAIGDCPDLASVAQALAKGEPRLRPLPAERHAGLDFKAPNGAYLDRVAIDALRLRVPPNDIDRMYPQQLLMLAVGDAALRDAGIQPGSRTAVIIAGAMDHVGHRLMARWESAWRLEDSLDAAGFALSDEERSTLSKLVREALHNPVDAVVMLSYVGSLLASRIAATWDLNGPAFMLTGDETGAVRAMDLGAKLLANGEADAVLVGAVDLAGAIENMLVRQAHGIDPTEPVGEGAVAIVMEPAETLRQRGGTAYAQWRGAGFADTPEAASTTVLANSKVDAIALVETSAGWPAEASLHGQPALGNAGAVFGHCRMVAPLLGTLHAALSLNARQLPAWAGWRESAHTQGLAGSAAYVPTEPRPWLRPRAGYRIAAVLAQDNDGSAAQALLAEAPADIATKPVEPALPLLLPIAGESRNAIVAELAIHLQNLEAGANAATLCLEAVRAYQAQAPLALVLVAEDTSGLRDEVRAALVQLPSVSSEWQSPRGSRFTAHPLGRDGGVAFVYSPLSTAFTGIASSIGQLVPGSIDALTNNHVDIAADTVQLYPKQLMPISPEQRMVLEEKLLADNDALIKAGVITSWQYTQLLTERIGLQPAARFGHSLGQFNMLFASGAWQPDDTWTQRLVTLGGSLDRLSGDLPAVRATWGLPDEASIDWTNLLVLAPAQRLIAAVQQEPQAYVSLINAPDEVVLVGDRAACTRIITALGADAVPAPDSLVMHCAPAAQEEQAIAAHFTVPLLTQPAGLQFAGGAPRDWTPEAVAERIAADAVSPLDFPALVERVYSQGVRLFLEVGPGANCSRWINKTLHGKPHASFALCRRDQNDAVMFGKLLSLLLTHRVPFDLSAALRLPPPAPKKPALLKDLVFGKPSIRTKLVDALRQHGLDQALARPRLPKAVNPIPVQTPALVNPSLNLATSFPSSTPIGIPPREVLFNEADVMEFAEGRVANVLGPKYAPIDAMPRRVRIPGPPFMAVSRITHLSGTYGKLEGSRIRTEYDIPDPAFNSIDGQASYLSLDAQGVLFLAGWLGIDFENQGNRAYRWLDAQLTYLGNMPRAGQRVEYDIHIVQSFRNGDATLFRTDFMAHVDGQPVLKIDHCTAGFFTYDELAKGAGITDQHRTKRQPTATAFVAPLIPPARSLEQTDLLALARGEIDTVMSPAHASGGRNPSLRLPPPVIQFIDRIVRIEATGGACGLGYSEAEWRIDPQHWAIRAHFKDDPVFPGPCMLEGAMQLLQTHALALGLQISMTGARFQPMVNRPVLVRFRAQVTPQNQIFRYRADIVEIGLGAEPYLIADIDLIDNGRVAGRVEGLGIRLVGQAVATSPVTSQLAGILA